MIPFRSPLPIPMPVFAPEGDAAAAAAKTDAGADAAAAAAADAAAAAKPDAAAAAAAAAAAEAAKPGNNFNAPPADKAAVAPADFPVDWREKMATGADGKVDAKELDRLKRMPDPGGLWKSYKELDARLNSGKPADVPMPDETKDAEGAKKWRLERGIPETAAGYEIPKPILDKMIPADKPVLENFTAFAHKKGMPPAFVATASEWYVGLMEEQAAATNERDKAQARELEDADHKLWGADYRANKTIAQRFATESLPGVDWTSARLPDGRLLGNVPGMTQLFAQLGLAKFGDVAFAGGEAAKVTESRIAELKNIMSTDIDKWNASPALRKEYFDLVSAAEKRPGQQG